jgi:hypothetical protein
MGAPSNRMSGGVDTAGKRSAVVRFVTRAATSLPEFDL